MFYVYVLLSLKDKKLYIGYTSNLERRIKEHNRGLTKSTRYRRPLVLIFYEAFKSESDARRREKYFKTSKGKSSLRQIIRDSL